MKQLLKLLLILFLIAGFFYFTKNVWAAEELNPIIINEIGAYEKLNFEWVEILNRGTSPIDLTGWVFYEDETNHSLKEFQGDLIIEPGEYAIIADVGDNIKTAYPSFSGTIIDSSWSSLKESGEEIALKDSDGNIVETFTYLPCPDFSLQRIDSNLDNYTETNWQEHPDSNTIGVKNIFSSPEPELEPETEVETEPEEEIITEPEIEEQNITTNTRKLVKGSVVINEFLANPPKGEVEWIEIFNKEPFNIDLKNWTIEDGSGRKTTLDKKIGSGPENKYLVIEKPKGALNNDKDTIILKDNNGNTMDFVTYGEWDDGDLIDNAPQPEKKHSIARSLDGANSFHNQKDFQLTQTITKGTTNIIYIEPEPIEIKEQPKVETKSLKKEPVQTQTATDLAVKSDTVTQSVTITKPEQKSFEAPQFNEGIIVSEIFPNPAGPDQTEFIEIQNISDKQINLINWQLDDIEGGSNPFMITTDLYIEPNQLYSFYKETTKLSLNNNEDSVRIINPLGEILEEIPYEKAKDNFSYSRIDDQWYWTESSTPNFQNVIITEPEDEESDSKTNKTNEDTYQQIDLSEINSLPEKTKVITQGVVSALPGTFSKQIAYLSGTGIGLYFYKATWPELQIGDLIAIKGEYYIKTGQPFIKIKNPEDISFIDNQSPPESTFFNAAEINQELFGWLVQIEGKILEKKGSRVYLADENGDEILVYLKKNTGIKNSDFQIEQNYKISGIVSKISDEIAIFPRMKDDIEQIKTEIPQGKVLGVKIEENKDPDYVFWGLLITIFVLTGIIILTKMRVLKFLK